MAVHERVTQRREEMHGDGPRAKVRRQRLVRRAHAVAAVSSEGAIALAPGQLGVGRRRARRPWKRKAQGQPISNPVQPAKGVKGDCWLVRGAACRLSARCGGSQ